MGRSLKATFLPEKKHFFCLPGTTIFEAAAGAGIIIDSPCAGKGTCGKCRVRVIKGRITAEPVRGRIISKKDWKKGVRLACRARMFSSAVIEIPESSRLFPGYPVKKEKGEKKKPRKKTDRTDCGLAFDVGTTTVVGTLLNLETGEELMEVSRMNLQAVHGDDVISRISFAISDKRGLERLHSRIIRTINDIIDGLARGAKISRRRIRRVVIAGNPAMQHLLLKVNPAGLGMIPFRPAVKDEVRTTAGHLGFGLDSRAEVFVFPCIAGFVGGDAVSVALATGLYRKRKKVKLAVDVGTNGEILFSGRGRFLCASAAAGPAFEGARISRGMRAREGAIEKVIIDKDVAYNVIGSVPPVGICGSGLIDCIAGLLDAGIISEEGRILSRGELRGKVPENLLTRVVRRKSVNDFLLVERKFTGDDRQIFITQRDVREFQLAKAALRAGIRLLADTAGIREKEIVEIMLAGAFGNFIRPEAARRVGLVPDIPVCRIKFVGNAASSGARLVLLSPSAVKTLRLICRRAEHINLSELPSFQEEFVRAMVFKK